MTLPGMLMDHSDETGGSIIGHRRSIFEMTAELESLSASPHYKTRQLILADTPTKGRLGDYYIIAAYGTKASEVFVCLRDVSEPQPPIAFKAFRQEFMFNSVARRAFRRECAIWARASIALGILPFWGLQEIEGRTFIAMPGVLPGPRGEVTLKDLISRELPSIEMVVFFARVISTSLFATAGVVPGIVHGDLKPSNILLMWGNMPFISDFGIARAAAHSLGGDALLGTPAYCSPLARNPSARLSVLDDVYSYGKILEELLIGSRRKSRHSRAARKDLADNATMGVRAELLTLARRCCSRSPSERPHSFNVIMDELDLIVPEEKWPIPDQVETLPNPIPSPFRVKSAAQALILLEEYDSARKFLAGRFRGVKQYAKQNWELSLYQGIAYSETNRPLRARASLRRAKAICAAQESEAESLNADLDSITYYYALAHRRDRSRKAVKLLRHQATNSIDSDIAKIATFSLAAIYMDKGRFKEAEWLFRSLCDQTTDALAWSHLGTAYIRLQEFERAVEACQRAVDLAPLDPLPYCNLGQALINIPARAEEALRMFSRAIDAGDVSQETLTFALIAAHIIRDRAEIVRYILLLYQHVSHEPSVLNSINRRASNTAVRLIDGTMPSLRRSRSDIRWEKRMLTSEERPLFQGVARA